MESNGWEKPGAALKPAWVRSEPSVFPWVSLMAWNGECLWRWIDGWTMTTKANCSIGDVVDDGNDDSTDDGNGNSSRDDDDDDDEDGDKEQVLF